MRNGTGNRLMRRLQSREVGELGIGRTVSLLGTVAGVLRLSQFGGIRLAKGGPKVRRAFEVSGLIHESK